MKHDFSISSMVMISFSAIVLVVLSVLGFMKYMDPIFVFTYASAMRICG